MIGAFRGWMWHNWVAAALAVLGCGWAIHVASVPDIRSQSGRGAALPGERSERSAEVAVQLRDDASELQHLVLTSVSQDLFRPNRARAQHRYRTPAEASDAAVVVAPPAPPAPPPGPPPLDATLILRGIAVDDRGRVLAAVEVRGESRLMGVGEEFAGFRLLDAGNGEARFRGPDGIRTVRMDP